MSGHFECQRGTSEAAPLRVTRSVGPNARTSPATSGGANVRIVVSLASLVRALSMSTGASHPKTGCSKAIEHGKTLVA